jgi:hypothetical protein
VVKAWGEGQLQENQACDAGEQAKLCLEYDGEKVTEIYISLFVPDQPARKLAGDGF